MEERKKYVPLGSRIFRVVQRIYIGLLILCLAIGSLSLAVNAVSAKIGAGVRSLTVRTDSMQPEFCEGDLAIVCSKSAEKISEGDVIAYRPGEEADAYLIHRVTEKISDHEGTGVICFYTAGDFNAAGDGILVDESHVIGTVILTIPELGYVLCFLAMRWYCPVLVGLAALLIFLAIHLARYWMDHREDDFPDGEEIAAGGFWLKNRNGKGIRIAKWQVAHVFSLLLILAAVAGIAVLWKVSEDEVVATLTQAENGGVVAVEDFADGSGNGETIGSGSDETTGSEDSGDGTSSVNQTAGDGETSEGNGAPVSEDSEAISAYQAIADELEGVRVMNTGNLESLIRAVFTGDGWSFDYEHVVTRAAGDAETESYITAIYGGKDSDNVAVTGVNIDNQVRDATGSDADDYEEKNVVNHADDQEVYDGADSGAEENENCLILRIYLASVVLSTDKENQDIESRYPSEEDYDMESEEGAEAYEEASQAADTSMKYSWTFDVGNSDGETAYLYYNYSLQPATGTKELVERVELVTNSSDDSSAVSLLCRMENIPVMRNEDMSATGRLQAAQDGYGWNLEVKSAYGVSNGIQISSKMFFRETIMLEWQTPEEKEKQLEEESGYGSMD